MTKVQNQPAAKLVQTEIPMEHVDTIETVAKVHTVNKKEITTKDIATTAELRDAVKRQEGLVRVEYDKIAVRKGFNLRVNYGNLEELANSIADIGLEKPLKVDILHDGTAILVDGERRFRAIGILRKRSEELAARFETVQAFIQDRKSDEKTRIITMMVSNSGKPFDPIEEAEGFRRLRDEHGMKDLKSIADSVGRSVPYVEQRLILADATPEEKQAMIDKLITPTAFVQLNRITRDAGERKEILDEAITESKKNGKKKVQVSDIERAKDNRKGGKKVDLADMEQSSRPIVVKKATIAEVNPLIEEALTELKDIQGLVKNNIAASGIGETMKILRRMKKILNG